MNLTDQGPGPSAPPFDFKQPLPLLVLVYHLADGVAACCRCAFREPYDVDTEGWSMPLIRHAWSHDTHKPLLPFVPQKKFTRAPRVKKAHPSTPADLESRSLFEE